MSVAVISEETERFFEDRLRQMRVRQERLRSFGNNVVGVVAQTASGVFLLDPLDGGVTAELATAERYEPDVFDAIHPLVHAGGSVLIVGAHVGAHVIPLSRRCRRLIAVEANPRTFAYLKANVLVNSCSNVEMINVAASDRHEKLEFLLNRDNSGGSKRMPTQLSIADVYDEPDVAEVEAAPLDDVVSDRAFDLVLMDVEGSELFSLRGMQEILAGVKALCVEFVADNLTFVAGADVDAFVRAVLPHFSSMRVVGSDIMVSSAEVHEVLRALAGEPEKTSMLLFQKGCSDI